LYAGFIRFHRPRKNQRLVGCRLSAFESRRCLLPLLMLTFCLPFNLRAESPPSSSIDAETIASAKTPPTAFQKSAGPKIMTSGSYPLITIWISPPATGRISWVTPAGCRL
jgi:hypothetical protein